MKILLCFLPFVIPFQVVAQLSDHVDSLLSSPYQALHTYTIGINGAEDTLPKPTWLFNYPGKTEEEKVDIASKFQQVLEGAGIDITLSVVPDFSNYYDSTAHDYKYMISKRYTEIFLLKRRGRWQLQPNEINQMLLIHKELYRFSSNFLLRDNLKTSQLNQVVFGIKLWQWIGLFLLIAVSIILRFILIFFIKRLLVQMLDKVGNKKIGSKIFLPIARPAGMMIVLMMATFLLPALRLPSTVSHYCLIFLKVLMPLYGIIILYRVVNIIELYMIQLAALTTNTLDDQLVPMVKKILQVSIVFMGSLMILDNLDIPIIPLLTGLSIGGLAFALAAQDTIKNFFGSLMILIDTPFQIGDWITTTGIDGIVEKVGLRSTRIRTFRNSVISIPNGALASQTIDNNGLRQYRRFRTIIKITYDTPASLVETYVDGLKQLLHSHPMTDKKKHEIHFNDLGNSSLDILFYVFFEAPTWSDELRCRQEILLEIMKLTEHLGIQFAFPTQTLHMESFPSNSLGVCTETK